MPRRLRKQQLPIEALPKVAIVGRPNVGKSAMFNRLAGSALAVVYDYPGVTRDRLYTRAFWGDKEFCLIDTGENPPAHPFLNSVNFPAKTVCHPSTCAWQSLWQRLCAKYCCSRGGGGGCTPGGWATNIHLRSLLPPSSPPFVTRIHIYCAHEQAVL